MLELKDVLSRFDKVKNNGNNQYSALCPCHDDRKQSLSIGLGNDGKILIHCQAGCSFEDIISKVGLSVNDITPSKNNRFDWHNVVAIYDYRNHTRKLRDRNKNFIWLHYDDNEHEYVAGRGNAPHTLYSAGNASNLAFVCEGEKDADNVSKLGYWAVSSENGAGSNRNGKKWYAEYTEELRGKDIIILYDNDLPGKDFAQEIALELSGNAHSIKLPDLVKIYPSLPSKGDISDVIDHLGTEAAKEKLSWLIETTDEWEPSFELLENHEKEQNRSKVKEMLEKDQKGMISSSVNNFLTILKNDTEFHNIKFNIMRNCPEKVSDGKAASEWTDSDDDTAMVYIEKYYGIYNRQKFSTAFGAFEKERRYHPVQDLLNTFTWDGKERCETFLIKWMGCKDTPYNRECSRLIFAGAVNRAYKPGCKFDCVIVFIGDQGGGKTTMVSWLALMPEYYSSVTSIASDKGREQIDGMWLCEIEELLATTANERSGTMAEERTKAFLTSTSDYYRRPYAHRSAHFPRTCIFIGTTNRAEFLTDKTGNRRWYPVRCNPSIELLHRNERDVKEDIRQAYAEMVDAYKNGKPLALPTEKRELLKEIREEQRDAETDDWRVGVIQKYLEDVKPEKVCCIELWEKALYGNRGTPPPYESKQGRAIGEILRNQLGWNRVGNQRFKDYGLQKAFGKPHEESVQAEPLAVQEDLLPVDPPDNPFL